MNSLLPAKRRPNVTIIPKFPDDIFKLVRGPWDYHSGKAIIEWLKSNAATVEQEDYLLMEAAENYASRNTEPYRGEKALSASDYLLKEIFTAKRATEKTREYACELLMDACGRKPGPGDIDIICDHAEVIATSETADGTLREKLLDDLTQRMFEMNDRCDDLRRYSVRKVLTAYMGSACGTVEHRSALFDKLLVWKDSDADRGSDSNKVPIFLAYLNSGNIPPEHQETLYKPQKDAILIPDYYAPREVRSLEYLLHYIKNPSSNKEEVEKIVDITIQKQINRKEDIYSYPTAEHRIVDAYLESVHPDDKQKKKITDDLLEGMETGRLEAGYMLQSPIASNYLAHDQVIYLRDQALIKCKNGKYYHHIECPTKILQSYITSKNVSFDEKIEFIDTLVAQTREEPKMQYWVSGIVGAFTKGGVDKLAFAQAMFDRMENDEDKAVADIAARTLTSFSHDSGLSDEDRKVIYDAMLEKFKEKCEQAEDLMELAKSERADLYFKLCPHTQLHFLQTLDYRLNEQDICKPNMPAKPGEPKFGIITEIKTLADKYNWPAFTGKTLRISDRMGRYGETWEHGVMLVSSSDITQSVAVLKEKAEPRLVFGEKGLQSSMAANYRDKSSEDLDVFRQYKAFLDISPEHSVFDELSGFSIRRSENFLPKKKL